MNSDIVVYFNTAKEAAITAGNFLYKESFQKITVDEDAQHDLKLKADKDSEKIIYEVLSRVPGIGILSEESGESKTSLTNEDNFKWIVDPLDGSVNYFEGFPLCCVSIGLWKGSVPVLGVIYDFFSKNLYSGIVGSGAWLNEKPIHVKKERPRNKSIIATGFPVSANYSDESIGGFVKKIQEFRKVRLLGTAALSLAFVAKGTFDVYSEKNIKIWDVAAGIALVRSAGGYASVTGYPESNITEVIAASSESHLK